jgi:hypothetical protein
LTGFLAHPIPCADNASPALPLHRAGDAAINGMEFQLSVGIVRFVKGSDFSHHRDWVAEYKLPGLMGLHGFFAGVRSAV